MQGSNNHNNESFFRQNGGNLLAAVPVAAIVCALLYLMARTVMFFAMDYMWVEKIIAAFLLFAEGFLLVHGLGYFAEILHVIGRGKRLTPLQETSTDVQMENPPPVVVAVASYKEPLDVIEDTLVCFYNLTYPNKHLVLLDDTRYDAKQDDPAAAMEKYRKDVERLCRRVGANLFRRRWHHAKAGIINDFLAYLDDRPKEGSVLYNYGNVSFEKNAEYLAIFDADMNPFPHFLNPLIRRMENDPKLAFLQTPQYYSNFESNRVAKAAGLQQAVFYEYICEGKSIKDAMFCCGTNVVFRVKALLDIGGFEEESVTEDFATSLKFHLCGWASGYSNRVAAFGQGPEDLGAYYKQQFRWALGTIGMLRVVLKTLLKHPLKLPVIKWWEYILSSTYYMVGFVFLIMVSCPLIFLFLNVPTYFAWPGMYLLFFIPYIVATLWVFFWTLRKRNYRIRDLYLGQILIINTFHVYIKASVLALLNRKGSFGVTPKTGSRALPLRKLWPNLTFLTLCIAAIAWGGNRLVYEQELTFAVGVNMLWCFYHGVLFSLILYINRVSEQKS